MNDLNSQKFKLTWKCTISQWYRQFLFSMHSKAYPKVNKPKHYSALAFGSITTCKTIPVSLNSSKRVIFASGKILWTLGEILDFWMSNSAEFMLPDTFYYGCIGSSKWVALRSHDLSICPNLEPSHMPQISTSLFLFVLSTNMDIEPSPQAGGEQS